MRGGGETGFTLLELLVVLAVLGLVAALMGPAIRPGGGDGVALRNAAAAAFEQLVAAREAAAQGGVQCVRLADAEQAAPGCAPLMLDAGVSLAQGSSGKVRFHDDGSNSGATVVLAAGALRRTLSVVGVTGQIRLQ